MEKGAENSLIEDEKKLYVFDEKQMDEYFKNRPWEKE